MLNNLLNNAVKYNETGGKISLQVSIQGEQAAIIVADNGIGISKDKQKHLYHHLPYQQSQLLRRRNAQRGKHKTNREHVYFFCQQERGGNGY